MTGTNSKRHDSIQEALTTYSSGLTYASLTPAAIEATKARVIDTFGALIGGFFGLPCKLARVTASRIPQLDGSTVIGTRTKTTPDFAAFANATTSRYLEANDTYHRHNSSGGHVSDVLMPVLAAAEHAHASGEELITASVIAYEVFIRLSDEKNISGWDPATLGAIGVAAGAAKVLGLSEDMIRQAISMAVIPNNALRQARTGELSMWKACAAGQAGRAGVFAALLARDHFAGPFLPFEGANGWLDHVARTRFSLDPANFGGNGNTFKIEETFFKMRTSGGATISSIMAAEKAFEQLEGPSSIDHVVVELYHKTWNEHAREEHHFHPENREMADHSVPYVVAATLHDGTITPRQFDDAHIFNPLIREILSKIEVVENPDFTRDNQELLPPLHRTRVTVTTKDGKQIVGESGGSFGDVSDSRSRVDISEKFTSLTQETLGIASVRNILDFLWALEDIPDVAIIPEHFAI